MDLERAVLFYGGKKMAGNKGSVNFVATSKEVKQKGEQAKVAIRNIRRDGMDALKKLKKDSEITEDDQKALETELQKLTDDYIKKVDQKIEQKTKEVMSV